MSEEVSANPPGADAALNVSQLAERLSGMPGREATDEANAENTAQVEGADAEETEQSESEAQPTDESEPTEAPEPEEQPKGRYKVKVNGEELTVTFDELRKGYQLEADYRQKTSKLAEERKALEAERTHYAEQLKGIIPALQVQLQDKFANVNWTELAKSDPAQYVALQAEYQQYATRLQIAQAEQRRIEAQTESQREAELKEKIQQERTRLAEKIPAFADPEKGKALAGELKAFLREVGFSAEDIGGVYDHRALVLAHDAMQYRKAQKAKVEAAKQGKVVPQVQKPGTATRTDAKASAVSAAEERYAKSHSAKDLAALLAARSRQS